MRINFSKLSGISRTEIDYLSENYSLKIYSDRRIVSKSLLYIYILFSSFIISYYNIIYHVGSITWTISWISVLWRGVYIFQYDRPKEEQKKLRSLRMSRAEKGDTVEKYFNDLFAGFVVSRRKYHCHAPLKKRKEPGELFLCEEECRERKY